MRFLHATSTKGKRIFAFCAHAQGETRSRVAKRGETQIYIKHRKWELQSRFVDFVFMSVMYNIYVWELLSVIPIDFIMFTFCSTFVWWQKVIQIGTAFQFPDVFLLHFDFFFCLFIAVTRQFTTYYLDNFFNLLLEGFGWKFLSINSAEYLIEIKVECPLWRTFKSFTAEQ